MIRIVKIVRREMARHRDAKLPVWVTELSWPAAQGKTEQHGGFETTETGQASGSRTGCRCSPTSAATLRIERVYWYTWLSAEGFTGSAFDYSGLRRVRDGAVARRARAVDVPPPGTPLAGLREARRRRPRCR